MLVIMIIIVMIVTRIIITTLFTILITKIFIGNPKEKTNWLQECLKKNARKCGCYTLNQQWQDEHKVEVETSAVIFLCLLFIYNFSVIIFCMHLFFCMPFCMRPKILSKFSFHYTHFHFRIPELCVCWRRVGCNLCTVFPQNSIFSFSPKIRDERVSS